LESKPASGYGGVLVVLHWNADGSQFKAVYGHIRRGPFPKGAKVSAGQVIGRVDGVGHVHFRIHPGRAYPPDRNPYRGHTHNAAVTYGWTDPIAYLKTHPRVKLIPPLPVVATIETSATPNVLGTADGLVYWSLETSDGYRTSTHVRFAEARSSLRVRHSPLWTPPASPSKPHPIASLSGTGSRP
jgi:murein DD-endopeptidase MepM/ murein hydrolase activator NlpD